MPVYIRDLKLLWILVSGESWNQSPVDIKGRLYAVIYENFKITYINVHVNFITLGLPWWLG